MAAKSKRRQNINLKSLKLSLRTPHSITNVPNNILGNKTTSVVSNANKNKKNNYGLVLVLFSKQTINRSGLLRSFTLHPISSGGSTEILFSRGFIRQKDCSKADKKQG